jgi:glycosyltransferase involved in cell wall biosynthesis
MVRSAPVTLTVSEYSRQQIIHYYDLDPVKVVNVGNGVSEAFLANGPAHQSIRPYFLYVGADRPHKNIELALRALKKVRGELDLAMICASNDRLVLQDRIDRLGLSADVQVVSNLDDEALARLYRGAIALILPSNYEGFGLPLVEALASGCEVIASNCTSIPEVLAGHGRLFEPNSLDELTQAMLTVASKSVRDESLSVKRRDRAADFNWDRVAERICLALANVFPVTAPAMRAGT